MFSAVGIAFLQVGEDVNAGPCPSIDAADPGPAGFSGSLVIACFSSLTEATRWANEDSYMTAGVFSNVRVYPFNRVFPA